MNEPRKCIRCGAWEDEDGRMCRDDHDHSFKPADHWLHGPASTADDGSLEPAVASGKEKEDSP